MDNVTVLTVATHSEGSLDELINNKFKIPIEILGYGKNWTGFDMKSREVYNKIKNLPDDDIVIYLDGFDTFINGNLETAIERFKKMDCGILFSKDIICKNAITKYVSNKIYSSCYNGYGINAGLYMGYVKYIKDMLKIILESNCKDDQRIVNNLCNKVNYIKIDINNDIFHNIYETTKDEILKTSNAIFFQTPGMITIKRYYRGFYEYSQFFIMELFIIFMVMLFILVYFKFNNIIILSLIVIMIMHFMYIEKSCIMYK
jgi:hypothetical protein